MDALGRAIHEDGSLRLYDSCSDANTKVVNQTYGDRRAIVSFVAVPGELARPVGLGIQTALGLHRRIRARS